jgi:hypothetical protein
MHREQPTGDVSKSPAVIGGVGEILAQGHDRRQRAPDLLQRDLRQQPSLSP